MAEMYDNDKHVSDTFNETNLSEYLLQAQWAEFIELKKAINSLYLEKKKPLKILDIGIGDARILKHLFGISELWSKIDFYKGIDVAQNSVDLSLKLVSELAIGKKVAVQLLDAVELDSLTEKYDLIISTWFTAGNFYPFNFSFENFKSGYDMSTNDKFTLILSKAYDLLWKKGELIIGSMYIDNEGTRKHQENAYEHFGWTVITDENDCFTATSSGWWSQRFTKQRVLNYLPNIPKNKFTFINLDTYDYAMMVKIKK